MASDIFIDFVRILKVNATLMFEIYTYIANIRYFYEIFGKLNILKSTSFD